MAKIAKCVKCGQANTLASRYVKVFYCRYCEHKNVGGK